MKILFNTSNFPKWKGEATTPFIFELAKALQSINHQIIILAPHAPGAKKFEAWDEVRIYRFKYFYPSSLETLFAGGGALINLRKNKLKYLLIPSFFITQVIALIRICLKEKPDMIHSHWILPQGLSGLFAKKIFKIPLVTSAHGSDVFTLNHPLIKKIKQFVLKHSDAITSNSLITKKALSAILKNPSIGKRITIIPMGINLKKFSKRIPEPQKNSFKKKYGISEKDFLILFVGRIVEEKGIDDLIEAFSLAKKQIENVKLLIVGEGRDLKRFQKKVELMGLKKDIIFTGWIDNNTLPMIYQIADIFVGPSKKSKEGGQEALGLTFVEAAASGCPVITTNETGFADYAKKYKSAIIVPPSDPLAISKTILMLIKNKQRVKELIKNGRKLAENEFDYLKIAKKFDNVYKKLIK